MRYEAIQTLSDEDFKRSTGVQRWTFEERLDVVAIWLGVRMIKEAREK